HPPMNKASATLLPSAPVLYASSGPLQLQAKNCLTPKRPPPTRAAGPPNLAHARRPCRHTPSDNAGTPQPTRYPAREVTL
ncbi:hypothetical protein ACNITO_27000, partial [Escherichia coli]